MASDLRLAAQSDPVEIAWHAFDGAALALHAMYRAADESEADPANSAHHRMRKAHEVANLWDAWRALYLSEGRQSR